MWSVYDKQIDGFLESGRNSDTKEEAVEEAFEFLTGDGSFSKAEIKRIKKDMISVIETFELEIREHNEAI